MKYENILGDLLRKNELSRAKIADITDMSEQTVDNWVKNRTQPTCIHMIPIFKLFNIKKLSDFVRGSE